MTSWRHDQLSARLRLRLRPGDQLLRLSAQRLPRPLPRRSEPRRGDEAARADDEVRGTEADQARRHLNFTENFPALSDSAASVQAMNDLGDSHDSVSEAWLRFSGYLASRLESLDADAVYTISFSDEDDIGAPYLQLVKLVDGDDEVLLAELSSNANLSEPFRLDEEQVSALLEIGWRAPTSPESPDPNPNFHGVFRTSDFSGIAEVIVTTLQFPMRVGSPSDLYEVASGDAVAEDDTAPSDEVEPHISGAWLEFDAQWVERVSNLEPGEDDFISVLATPGTRSPFIRTTASDDGEFILVEVSSNQILPNEARLSPNQIGELLALGWSPPSAPGDDPQVPNFFAAARIDSIDELAELVVDTLRGVFGIPHPSFLTPAPNEDQLHLFGPGPDPHANEPRLPTDQPYHPADLRDLRWAISHVIRNMYDKYVAPDNDGVFAIRTGSAGLLIQAIEPGAVSIVAFAVTRMRHPERADDLVSELNGRTLYVHFHVRDDDVVALCDIPARPFIPGHLIEVIITAGRIIDAVDEDIASTTGGVALFGGDYRSNSDGTVQDESYDDKLPEELLALIHIDNQLDEDVDPDLVARLMKRDRSLILHCIRLCEEQGIEWRQSASEEDDEEEKAAHLHEADAWDRTVSLLGKALVHTID